MQVPLEPQKRQRGPHIIDAYREYLTNRLHEHPGITGKRLFREIQERGYTLGYTSVKDSLRAIRQTVTITAIYRYKTGPGEQGQVDWGECGQVEIDEEERTLYCFAMILGYSRMRYIEFTVSTDVATFIRCHLNAFRHFGGYPREILYDNMKQAVIRRVIRASESRWNPLFEDFSRHYESIPRLCRPYRPQTKGKCLGS